MVLNLVSLWKRSVISAINSRAILDRTAPLAEMRQRLRSSGGETTGKT